MKIHFIGIGGIGVSALSQYYLAKGHKVSGSDLIGSEMTELLSEKGIELFVGPHKAGNLPKDADSVIYSPAVQSNNPELKKALELQAAGCKLQVLSYPEALGELTKKYFTIAVSGTHGKSTACAMVSSILIKAGLNPTVIIGTKLKEFNNSNFRAGKGKFLVIEADEWNASFLNYWPKIIVLTNIEKEHLDYYKNLNHILRTYKEYLGHLPKDGMLVANREDKNIQRILSSKFKIQNFSLKQKTAEKLRKILKVPGEHNVANALAALAVARILKIPDKISFTALANYKGAWRRFELKESQISGCKFQVISDYAHHPTEIAATLKATQEKFPSKKIWCVFQPHQYQRTFYLFKDFIEAFQKNPVQKVIITDIYEVSGRESEEIKKRVSAEKLVKKITRENTIYLPKDKIIDYLKKNLKGEEVVIVMGAGDIYKLPILSKKSSH